MVTSRSGNVTNLRCCLPQCNFLTFRYVTLRYVHSEDTVNEV